MIGVFAVWLVAVGATLAGTAAVDAGAPWLAGAAIAGVLGVVGGTALRRVLARLRNEPYDLLPPPPPQSGAAAVVTATRARGIGLAGLAAGGAVAAAGQGEQTAIGVPLWLAAGLAASWPVVGELAHWMTQRFAERTRRKDDELRRRIDAVAPTAATIPIARARCWAFALGLAAAGFGLLAVAVFVEGLVDRALFVGCAAIAFWGSLCWERYARAPFALRPAPDGLEVLGDGRIPWSVIRGAQVRSIVGLPYLSIRLTTHLRRERWSTPTLHRLIFRGGGREVQLPVWACARPPSAVLAEIEARATGTARPVLV